MAYIINCGAATPVGRSCPVSVASARAGIARLTRHPNLMDRTREPVIVGMAQYVNEFADLKDRFCRLTRLALTDAVADLDPLRSYDRPIPLILALPEPRPGLPADLQALLTDTITELSVSTGVVFEIEFIEEGQSGGLSAIKQAQSKMEEENSPFAIAGGVDCYFDVDTMAWLEGNKRLFAPYHNDGFIPGEAAAFCVLASEPAWSRKTATPITEIKSIGISNEPRPHGSEQTTLGEGLSSAVNEALQIFEAHRKVDQIFYGMNGESYHALELGYALSRHGQKFNDVKRFVNWTRSWGDLGAASALVSICCIVESARKNYLKGPLNMVLASSLGKQRAAAILETMGQE